MIKGRMDNRIAVRSAAFQAAGIIDISPMRLCAHVGQCLCRLFRADQSEHLVTGIQ